MHQTAKPSVPERRVPWASLWLAVAAAWIPAIAAAMLQQTLVAMLLAIAGPLLVATWGLAPIRRALFGEQLRLSALLNAVPEGVLEVDARGVITFANPQLCDLFGYLPHELVGQPVELLVPQESRHAHVEKRAAFWSSARSRPMGSGLDITGVRKDGTRIPVDISLTRVQTRRGPVMYCLVRDSSARHAFETRLVESNRRLKETVATLERSSLELHTLNEMGELLHSSHSEQELYGILSRTMERLFPGWTGALYMVSVSRETARTAHAWGREAARLKTAITSDDCWALRRGRPHHVDGEGSHPPCSHHMNATARRQHCVPLTGQGELLGILHLSEDEEAPSTIARAAPQSQFLQALANQVALSTANLRLRNSLRAQSTIDPLTGLGNRRLVDERFDALIQQARAEGRDVALLVLDVDHFKTFNDHFGHECGDLVLREIGAVLRRSLRHDDLPCRLGGEEFVVLLPDTSLTEAERVAEKLRNSVEQLRLQRNGYPLGKVSVSAGVASVRPESDTVEALMRRADRALYRAKAAGRNCVMVGGFQDDTGVQPRLVLAHSKV